MIKTKPLYNVLLGIVFIVSSCNNPKRDLYPETLVGSLQLLPPEKTGIDFNNAIKESKTVNHLYYNQLYSGAGVAIGDINNDGLPDIFFCGNQVNDRLYLNKGNFQFEDITKKARVAVNPGWSWGVTMADINNDGYLDIYVSRNGDSMKPEERKNQLYINNQDLTFTESAMQYGLADAGFSSQAVFFDMDNDGDLDVYQVNQPPDSRLFKRYINIPKERYKFYTDKLYKNENGRFVDASNEVKISKALTYGLSVNASDFNNDGWTDLYVANDYDEPDYMYYNNGDGTFTNVINTTLKHISRFSMGTDTGDINNDGLMDLVTLDMAAEDHYRSKTNMSSMNEAEFNKTVSQGKHYQYMANVLQVNSGIGTFFDVAHMAGVAKTDWSWGSLLVDLDNDGWKDLVITNGIKKDIRNNDFLTGLHKKLATDSQDFYGMTKDAPSEPLSNYVYKNKGGLTFEKTTKEWGFDVPSYSSGMAYGDLDNDGDLDVVINNMEAPAFIYENKATGNFLKIACEGPDNNTFGFGAKATIHYNNKTQISENTVTRGYFSSVEPGMFFGLGKDVLIDKVEVTWQDGKKNIFKKVDANKTLIAKYSKAEKVSENKNIKTKTLLSKINATGIGLPFIHKENEFDDFKNEVLLPHKLSQNGPFTAIADVNGDGLEDVFIGSAAGESGTLYIQKQENGLFSKSTYQPWENDKASEDLGCLFIDIDGDNDKDLFVASGGSEFTSGNTILKDRIYINNGSGEFKKQDKLLPNIYESSQCIKASDVDADGDLDLFVGVRLIPGKYGFPASSYLLINENGVYKKASDKIAPDLQNIGMVTDAVFTDFDNDKDDDLIIVGEWMQIIMLKNNNGVFNNITEELGLADSRGMWWSITAADLDNDGDDDYIVGNLGLNNKFKASKEHPFKLYANDFDNNGTNDVVLSKFYKDDYVPLRGRECTSQQMPFVAEKFKDYHSFASSKLLEILPEDKVKDAVIYEINSFESIILINESGKLIKKPLPIEAQVSPIKSSIVLDINNDGINDIITVGNHYGVEVETTRYDAGIGSVFLGDENNNFNFVKPSESGFYIPYDSRDIEHLKQSNKNLIIVANNNAPLSIFSYKK